MLVREQTQTKKSTGVFISLTVHAVLVALLFLALTEKHLTSDLFTSHTKSLVANTIKKKQAEKNSKQEEGYKLIQLNCIKFMGVCRNCACANAHLRHAPINLINKCALAHAHLRKKLFSGNLDIFLTETYFQLKI